MNKQKAQSRGQASSRPLSELCTKAAADGFHQATHGGVRTSSPGLEVSRGDFTWYVIMDLKITPLGQTIVKPTALGPVANTDTKLLIYGLFQKG